MRGTGPAVVSQTGGKSHHGTRNVGWRRKETRVSMETTREEPGSADSSVSAQENPGQASSPRGPSGDATFALYRAAKSAAGGPGSNGGATAVASPRPHWRGGGGASSDLGPSFPEGRGRGCPIYGRPPNPGYPAHSKIYLGRKG